MGNAAGLAVAFAALLPLLQSVWERHKQDKQDRQRLELLDGLKKLASEDAGIIGAFAPLLIDAIGRTRCALRDEGFHDFATSRRANACASS